MYYPSVKEEYIDPVHAQVTGSIPAWLEGSLYRNGPGLFEVGDSHYNHLFDGLGKLHKFTIKDGAVTYQSRFIQSETYKKNMAANRIVVTEFGTLAMPDPCKNIFQRLASTFTTPEMTDNTLVNVYPIGDQLYTASEGSVIHRIDKETLETMGIVDISKLVAVNTATAHPHVEKDGTVYNLGMMHKEGKYAIIKIKPLQQKHPDPSGPALETAEIVATVPAQSRMKPAYFHSFAMTENYFVMIESPLVMNVLKLMTSRIRGKAYAGAIEWNDKGKCVFHVIDKQTGKLVNARHAYEAQPFFTFHHANAYEENGTIIMDMCAFDDGRVIQQVDMAFLTDPANKEAIKKLPVAHVRRFVLPLNVEGKDGDNLVQIDNSTATAVLQKGKKVHLTHNLMAESSFEFPRINYSLNGQKYQYLYGVSSNDKFYLDQQLIRLDLESGAETRWGLEGYTVSEPTFVANPDARAEDDGVLLSIALNPDPDKRAFLVILDASNMAEVARAEVDVRVHKDFHGDFFPSSF